MRICIFSTAYLPYVGGAEIAVQEISKRLSDFEFDLFTARLSRKLPRFEKIGNVNIHRIGFGFQFDKKLLALFGGLAASRKHKQKPYDLCWAIMASYGGFAALSFKKNNPAVSFLLTLQEGDAGHHILRRVKGLRWRFRQIFEYADALQCISAYLLEWGRRMGFNGQKERTIVIPNGVNLGLFSRGFSAQEILSFRSKLRIGKDDKLVATVSRLAEKNGLQYLIGAFKFLPANVHCVIVGDGALEDALKKQARDLEVLNRVHFLGYVSHENLPLILKSADVFCRPSLSEGFGNVFLEAMAAGVAVVATPVGGIVDIIQHGENGLFCNIKDPEDLANKVMQFINNKELRARCVKGGLEFARNFDWAIIAQKMKVFFFVCK
jgi:glycosyltransferase involved in cell wall biosynthesis